MKKINETNSKESCDYMRQVADMLGVRYGEIFNLRDSQGLILSPTKGSPYHLTYVGLYDKSYNKRPDILMDILNGDLKITKDCLNHSEIETYKNPLVPNQESIAYTSTSDSRGSNLQLEVHNEKGIAWAQYADTNIDPETIICCECLICGDRFIMDKEYNGYLCPKCKEALLDIIKSQKRLKLIKKLRGVNK